MTMKHVRILIGSFVIKTHDDLGDLIAYDSCVLPPFIRFGRRRAIEGQDLERSTVQTQRVRNSLTGYSPYFDVTLFGPAIHVAHIHRSPTNREAIHVGHRSGTAIISTPFHLQGNRSCLGRI
jgi:hypothetical protein